MQHADRRTRGVVFVALAAMVVGLSPVGAAADDGPVVRDTSTVCEGRDGAAGTDVPGHPHERAIRCISDYEIARGYGDATFGPDRTVTRGQMASFVASFLTVADAIPPGTYPLEGGTFTDTDGDTHESGIELLAALDVVQGRADGTFGPGEPVTRGQMSRFLVRAIDQAHTRQVDGSEPPAASTTRFDDAHGTLFAANIEQLRELGIYLGNAQGEAMPHAVVSRGQMASFLTRTASYLDELHRWRPTYDPIVYEVAMSWANVTDGEGAFYLGEEDAVGGFAIGIDEIAGALAYAVTVDDVSRPYPIPPALTVHRGELDEVGPVVLAIDANHALAFQGSAQGTMPLPAGLDVAALRADPEGFYVQVRNVDHPDGAVRGQLPDGGQDELPDPPASYPGAEYLDPLLGPIFDLLEGLGLTP